MSGPRMSVVSPFAGVSCQLGEGIIWDSRAKRLLLVDILGKSVLKVDPNENSHALFTVPEAIGWILPSLCDRVYAVGMKSGIACFDAEAGAITAWESTDFPRDPSLRLNDACVDTSGRIWYGSMCDGSNDDALGCLASYAPDEGVIIHDAGFEITNGPAVSPCGRYLFCSDSAKGTIFRYDLDEATPSLTGRLVFAQFALEDGLPDGMCFDVEGNLWVAVWGGGKVLQFDGDGSVRRQLVVPATNVTNVCYFGDQMDKLAVSSALSQGVGRAGLGSGGQLFYVEGDLGVGAPLYRCRLKNQ